jgi:hypothetical protein
LVVFACCARAASGRRAAEERDEMAAADHPMTAFVIALRASRA